MIVTDVVMPGVSGGQLLAALRENARWRAVPVVVMTGNNDTALPLRLDATVVCKPDTGRAPAGNLQGPRADGADKCAGEQRGGRYFYFTTSPIPTVIPSAKASFALVPGPSLRPSSIAGGPADVHSVSVACLRGAVCRPPRCRPDGREIPGAPIPGSRGTRGRRGEPTAGSRRIGSADRPRPTFPPPSATTRRPSSHFPGVCPRSHQKRML